MLKEIRKILDVIFDILYIFVPPNNLVPRAMPVRNFIGCREVNDAIVPGEDKFISSNRRVMFFFIINNLLTESGGCTGKYQTEVNRARSIDSEVNKELPRIDIFPYNANSRSFSL